MEYTQTATQNQRLALATNPAVLGLMRKNILSEWNLKPGPITLWVVMMLIPVIRQELVGGMEFDARLRLMSPRFALEPSEKYKHPPQNQEDP
jgi:hypothetical protein